MSVVAKVKSFTGSMTDHKSRSTDKDLCKISTIKFSESFRNISEIFLN